jgi:hypothetical protein
MRKAIIAILVSGFVFTTASALSGEADVLEVSVRQAAAGAYAFSVTVAHGDTGWDHYSNRWQVLGPDGTVLGERVLLHPHEHEQPFTRSLSGIVIPEGIEEVTIRAGDSVHEFGGVELIVELAASTE